MYYEKNLPIPCNDCGYSFYRVWAEEKRRSSNRYIVACIRRTDRIAIKRSD